VFGQWIQKPSGTATTVFVHGILSDGKSCWTSSSGAYWPQLLASDFPELGVYSFTYETDVFSGNYQIGDAVNALLEHLGLDGALEQTSLIFVCHSMGGIVVRRALVKYREEFIRRNSRIGLFLVASPSLGSEYANWLSALANLVGQSQAKALRFSDENTFLNDLDQDFLNLRESGALSIKGRELIEHESIALKRLWRKPIVRGFSAGRYFGKPYKVPRSDHFTIAKPSDSRAEQHRLLVRFLEENFELKRAERADSPIVDDGYTSVGGSGLQSGSRHGARSIVGFAILSLTVFALYWAWRTFVQVETRYFQSYVRKFGIWQGLNEVTASRASRMSSVYVLKARRARSDQPLEVSIQNGSGECASPGIVGLLGNTYSSSCSTARACKAHFEYDSAGRIRSEELLDQYGHRLEILTFSDKSPVAQFQDEAGFGCSRTKTGVEYARFTRFSGGSELGLDQEIEFLDASKRRAANFAGATGFRFTYDGEKRLVAQSYLGGDGGRTNTTDYKCAGIRLSYDNYGLLVEKSFVAIDDAPCMSAAGYAIESHANDSFGNSIRLSYLDKSRRSVINSSGYAVEERKYDMKGNLVENSFLDREGKPTLSKDGYSKEKISYDRRSGAIERSYFGLNSQLTARKDGFAVEKISRDKFGNAIKYEYFDSGNKPTLSEMGYHTWRLEYDERGDQIGNSYFGLDGKPTHVAEGLYAVQWQHDKSGRITKYAYFDERGAPTYSREGYWAQQVKYDDDSGGLEAALRSGFEKPTEFLFLDIDGNISANKEGVARNRFRYDQRGNEIETEFLDSDGARVFSNEGYAIVRTKFDSAGNEIEYSYFDTAEKPTLNKDGFATVRMEYDNRGNLTKYSYFDLNGALTRSRWGCATSNYRYDDRGNTMQSFCFDESGKPGLWVQSSVHSKKYEYDERDNEIKQAFLDSTGKSTSDSSGVSITRVKFDAAGRAIETAVFSIDDRPIANQNTAARVRVRRDVFGRDIESTYFGVRGEPVNFGGYSIVRKSFDSVGNETEISYLNSDGSIGKNTNGYSTQKSKFDRFGNAIEVAYFGVSGERVSGPEKCSITRRKFDRLGNEIEVACFGTDEEPALDDEQVAVHQYEYDRYSNFVAAAFFDVDGKPASVSGFSRSRSRYDQWSNLVERSYLDSNGRAVSSDDGFSTRRMKYDALGRETEQRFFDAIGKPISDKNGCARVVTEYAKKSSILVRRYFNASGRVIKTERE
jgi:pimeloyl-ACP methyl ester carboxylesterase